MTVRNIVLAALLLTGCAATQRDCASCNAKTFGGDWIIVQYRFDGEPMNCWQLRNVAVVNETGSDGIWWRDENGHLVHLSGWYNRIQVNSGDFKGASKTLGLDEGGCLNGKYVALPKREVYQ